MTFNTMVAPFTVATVPTLSAVLHGLKDFDGGGFGSPVFNAGLVSVGVNDPVPFDPIGFIRHLLSSWFVVNGVQLSVEMLTLIAITAISASPTIDAPIATLESLKGCNSRAGCYPFADAGYVVVIDINNPVANDPVVFIVHAGSPCSASFMLLQPQHLWQLVHLQQSRQ